MIHIRRAEARHHERGRRRRVWRSFARPHANLGGEPLGDTFGALLRMDEQRLPRGGGMPSRLYDAVDVVVYVREGCMAYEDGTGATWLVRAGEFETTHAGNRTQRWSTEASSSEGAHVFEFCFGAVPGPDARVRTLRRFGAGMRRGELCVVASGDARRGSNRLGADVALYSGLLAPGQHIVHALGEGRAAWLHVVLGRLALAGDVLLTGDGASLVGERSVSFTALDATEILLVEVPQREVGAGPPPSIPPRSLDSCP